MKVKIVKLNKIKQYLSIVKNISPIRIGNGEDEGNGLLLIDKHAVISGTTLAGAFRNFLNNKDSSIYDLVFGEGGDISSIYFYDSFSIEEIDIEDLKCREHVKIDYKTSSSFEKCLFNEYHILEGKTFNLTFEIRGFELGEEKYAELCNMLEEFIELLSDGKIAIGSNKTFGFGNLKSVDGYIYEHEFDLSDKTELSIYLETERIEKEKLETKRIEYFENNEINVCFKAYCEDGFIVKGSLERRPIKKDGRDRSVSVPYYEKSGEDKIYIISSSTIKGVIRNYIDKIYRTLDADMKDIETIFGKRVNDNRELKDRDNLLGKVIFYDVKVKDFKLQTYNRIKIDRFTGGTMGGSLFSEDLLTVPRCSPVKFNITVKQGDRKALALILLTLRDIGLGHLPIGSGSNVGYGRFKGTSITVKDTDCQKYTVTFKDKGEFDGDLCKFEQIISEGLR